MAKKIKVVKKVEETPASKVAEISKEIVKVEKEAIGIVVKTQADYENASKFLSSVVKPRVNRINELVKFFTEPFVEARRFALENKQNIELMFSKQVNSLALVEASVKKVMTVYLQDQDVIARKEEKRLADLRDAQNKRNEEKGKEAVAMPLPVVERPVATVRNDEGGRTTAKKVWAHKIVNMAELRNDKVFMEEFFILATNKGLHEQVLRSMVNRGVRKIQGVEIFETFDISAKA